MKDYWRPFGSRLRTELESYERLRKHDVAGVATAIAGGDVIDMNGHAECTQSQNFWAAEESNPPTERRHYRLVTREIGRPLSEFHNFDQFILFVFTALLGSSFYHLLNAVSHPLNAHAAHQEAWEKAGILHRDISWTNIMIDIRRSPDGALQAFLNDWDLCKWKIDETFGPTQPGRSVGNACAFEEMFRPLKPCWQGTWPYMSAHVLQYPKKPNEVCDDLESIVYVIVEGLLRFYPHSHSPPTHVLSPPNAALYEDGDRDLAMYVQSTFYEARVVNRYVVGGNAKLRQIKVGKPDFRLDADPGDVQVDLQTCLDDLYGLLKKHYDAFQSSDYLKQFSVIHVNKTAKKLEQHPNVNEHENIFSRFKLLDKKTTVGQPPPKTPQIATVLTAERPAQTVLDTHDAMVALFMAYLFDPDTNKPRAHYTHAKTNDQFKGLSRTVQVKDIGPSSGSALSSTSTKWSIATPQIPTLDVTQELNDAEAEQDVFAKGVNEVTYDLSHLGVGHDNGEDEVVEDDE
jgi:hypothetical protein